MNESSQKYFVEVVIAPRLNFDNHIPLRSWSSRQGVTLWQIWHLVDPPTKKKNVTTTEFLKTKTLEKKYKQLRAIEYNFLLHMVINFFSGEPKNPS